MFSKEIQAVNYLKRLNIRPTPIRLEIIQIFLKENKAIGYNAIKEKIKKTKDKVTIYRTIALFLEKGILHKVNDGERECKYALRFFSEENEKTNDHLHFKCEKCSKIICIEEATINIENFPEKYKLLKLNLFAEGICDDCLEKNNAKITF